MSAILKVFCTGPDQGRLAETYRVVERYQGFVLVEVSEGEVDAVAERYPVEDITDLYTVRVGDRTLDTSRPRLDIQGKIRSHPDYKGEKKLAPGPHHYLVQFVGPIKEGWLEELGKMGGEICVPQEAFTYIVRADEQAIARIAGLAFVRWIGHLAHRDRLAPSALAAAGRKPDESASPLPRTWLLPGAYTVEFFALENLKTGLKEIENLGFEVLNQDADARVLVLRDTGREAGAAKRLRDLSAVHGVRSIRKRTLKRTSNDVAAGIMGTRAAMDPAKLGLSGAGEIIAICDTGLDTGEAQTVHPDFRGRITEIMSYPITPDLDDFVNNPGGDDGAADLDSGHGTHVAGSVLGDGAASLDIPGNITPIRGLAHRAKLLFQAIEQEMQWKDPSFFQHYGRYLLTGIPLDLNTLFADAYEKNARIHSNSWGGGEPGAYDDQCEQLDRFVWEHRDFCILFANGNDGTDQDGDGQINLMSVTSPATAKNCISVGASENQRPDFTATYGDWWPGDYPVNPIRDDAMADNPEQVVAFSSRGPTADGRTKPDVVAPGTFILSTRSTMIAANNMAWAGFPPSRAYFHMGGTSMATPLAAGAVALVREYLRKHRQIPKPSAALLKATLVAGARRLPGSEAGMMVDNHQGFGRIDLDAVLAPPEPMRTEFFEMTPGLRTGELHSMGFSIRSGESPLRVVLAYTDFPGPALVNNLNLILKAPDGQRFVGNQASATPLRADSRNNVEVVHIANPVPGSWVLEVVGSNVSQGPQDFALVYTADLGEPSDSDVVHAEASPALDIPDDDPRGVNSVLSVTGAGLVGSIKVGVDISHTYIGDLRVALTAPDQTRVLLHNRSGASTNDLIRTYDVQSTPDLVSLKGIPLQGDWQLTVSDHARRDAGRLRHWSLTITSVALSQILQERTSSVSIPDNEPTGVIDTIDVAHAGTLRDIRVWLDITHTWVGDLKVELTAPSGRSVVLHNRSGGSMDNIIKSYDRGGLPELASLVGQDIQGKWLLKVADLAGRDVGKLNRWGLEISL